ncbi:phosphatidate cytidylyltransferase [Thermotomaculum hydrothermale]|uniref:Phosphatidate cytidylyltransferase n=1 Tax=Thermotomaculum hydrothermale TaxID=981385 RepID=A0A7R6SZC4_9BACT|nr:phosphatidate cytidylyltransferase [Thermotomaculum hydrothermale]BBB32700.1 phosphatidate cytidylyltransferase [Thermotomaculum hydrothermale]
MAFNIKSFILRAISTIVFVPLFFVVVKYLPVYYFYFLVIIAIFLGIQEFKSLSVHIGSNFYAVPAFIIAALIPTSFVLKNLSFEFVISGGFVFLLIYAFFKDPDTEKSLQSVANTLLGALYLGIPLGYQVALKNSNRLYEGLGADLVFLLYVVIWFGDSGAYWIGSMFGKHKLAPNISPNKSIEGAIGNIIFNFLGATLAKMWFFTRLTWHDVIAITIIIGVSGIIGDLIESLWKRCAGVKDSATLIPGHGGILDRIDSFVLSSPLLYFYFLYLM